VIRLGYALMFHSDEEVAAALAYWQSVHEPFPWQQNLETDLELALQQQTPIRLQEQRFGGRIRELRELGQYPQARSDLASCRKVALKVYQCTRNFFALHLVTSCQALQCCVAEVDDPELEATAEAAMASAILAAHLVLDAPQLALGTVAELPPRLDPEHAYKYVYSCLVEYHSSGNLAYLEEAKGFKAQGLVPDWVVLE